MSPATTGVIEVGQIYVCVSQQGQGVPVKVERVTPNSVRFKAIGRGGPEHAHGARFSTSLQAFRLRYALMKDVPDRQKQLQRASLNGGALANRTPPSLELLAKAAIDVVDEHGLIEPQPAPSLTGHALTGQKRKRVLGPKEAREIWLLCEQGTPAREVGEAYGISGSNVSKIWAGSNWPNETADLRAAREQRLAQDLFDQAAARAADEVARQATADSQVGNDEHEEEVGDMANTSGAAKAGGPAQPAGWVNSNDLVVELLEALEAVVEFEGRPMPRFLAGGIRTLAEQTRIAVNSSVEVKA